MKLSVIVTTSDRPLLLRLALESLIGQLPLSETQVIIANAGADPLSRRPVPPGLAVRIVDVGQGRQVGQAAAINAGLAHSTGDLVTIVEDDDTVLPGGHLALRTALLSHPECSVVYSLPRYTDPDGGPMETPPRLRRYLLAHPTVSWADVLTDGLFIHGTATMYRRVALDAIGGWDATLHTAEEYDAHLRLLHAGFTFQALDQATVTYRRHEGGKSQNRKRRRAMRVGVMARIYARLGLHEPPELPIMSADIPTERDT